MELIVAIVIATMFTRTCLNATMQYSALNLVSHIDSPIHKNDDNVQTTRPSLYMRSFGVATNSTRNEEAVSCLTNHGFLHLEEEWFIFLEIYAHQLN